MSFRFLANVVLAIHLAWIFFMIIGPFLFSLPKLRIFHPFGLLAVFIMEILAVPCPLTHLEEWLIRHQDPSFSYGGSMIQYYLIRLVYPDLPPSLILSLTLLLLLITAALLVWRNPFKKSTRNA